MVKHLSIIAANERSPLLEPESTTNLTMLKHGLTGSRAMRGGKAVPQTIGHRGFKAAAPENTMAAFKAATEAGVDALETDLHLTRDGVVVLCHDETLQRCYGNKAKVRDLDWSEISQLRTLREPHQPMPRLIDLLEYLDLPGLEDIWLMLDIKVFLSQPCNSLELFLYHNLLTKTFVQTHDDAEEIMKRTAETLASVSSKTPWSTRVTPCCWNATYIKLSMTYLPDYHITHVGFSTSYARCLTHIPNISFSMLRHTIASPFGGRFLRDMKQLGIPVHVWTVNEESWMEWSVRQELSGVITDEVALFHDVCDRIGNAEGQAPATSKSPRKTTAPKSWFLYQKARFWGEMALIHFLITIFLAREWLKHGSQSRHINKVLNG
ncbi:PLC-like phosphodiesterase [Xylaria digitata]|nr:PLC-like phosphodiesterase [Xylaria digitata]